MIKYVVIVIAISVVLFSCGGVGLNIRKTKLTGLDSQFASTFSNYSYHVNRTKYGSPSLLDLFELYHINADSVSLQFDSMEQLRLTYFIKGSELEQKLFSGKFSENGYYFEVFLRNDKDEWFKNFPIFYGRYDVNRLRIALTSQYHLIVDNSWNRSGRILFLGVGDNGRRQSFFSE